VGFTRGERPAVRQKGENSGGKPQILNESAA